MTNTNEGHKTLTGSLRSYYRIYRQWRKEKGRKAKQERNFKNRLNFYRQFVRSGDLCFDIGAHIGNRTEVFLALNAVVVAVEPQESCFRILQERFKTNPNLILINKGLDQVEGERELFISSVNTLSTMSHEWIKLGGKGRLFEGCSWGEKIIVKTTTLDALINAYGIPAFCKIDVEGFEYDVLRGLSKPVKTMSFEFTQEFIESAVDCIRYLSGLGMAKFNYSEGESMSLALSSWVKANEILDILASLPNDKKYFGDVYVQFRDALS